MAAWSPSSGSRSGTETTNGTTHSATATTANVLRSADMVVIVSGGSPASGQRHRRDQWIVIRSVAAFRAADHGAPAGGELVKDMVQAHESKRRPPIGRTRRLEAARELAVGGVVVAKPRVEVSGDDDR